MLATSNIYINTFLHYPYYFPSCSITLLVVFRVSVVKLKLWCTASQSKFKGWQSWNQIWAEFECSQVFKIDWNSAWNQTQFSPNCLLCTPVRGHLSVSLPPLSSPTLPLFICILPTPLYHLQGPHPKANDPCIQSPTTFQISTHRESSTSHSFHPLVPQQYRTYLGRIRIGPCDTAAPSTVTWKANYGRLGTGRLGTVITSIYFVVRPSQGSLERSLWISPD
jgi:hypothetical protein